jgi:hypothetical protein
MSANLDRIFTRVIAFVAVLLIGGAVIMVAHATDKQDAARWARITAPSQSAVG